MDAEDEFDSQLRETFIIVLFLVVSLAICSAFLFGRKTVKEEDEPFLSSALSAVSLTFAFASLFVVPVDQALQAFPNSVAWFGIDGQRFSNTFAYVAMAGSTLSLFLLNPFAFLFAEASDGTWKSFWTTIVELALLLLMLFCIALLFFTRSTIYDAMFDPTRVVLKLTSLLMHVPGSLAILYLSPKAIVSLVSSALGGFVPWRRDFLASEARRLKEELATMQEWTTTRKRSVSDSEELRREIERLERAAQGHPLVTNLKASVRLAIALGTCIGVLSRIIVPASVYRFLLKRYHLRLVTFLLVSLYLLICIRAFRSHASIASFFASNNADGPRQQQLPRPPKRTPTRNSIAEKSIVSGDLPRTDSNLSMTASESLSLARFVSYALVFCSSSSVVLAGMFALDLTFPLKCHPQLRHPIIVNGYSAVFVLMVVRELLLTIPALRNWFKRPRKTNKAE